MRNLKFTGQVQRTQQGFDPLRIPDPAQKILQESERTIRGMRNYQNEVNEQRREQLSAIKDTAEIERRSRSKAEGLREEWAKAYHDGEMQIAQREIEDRDRTLGWMKTRDKINQANREKLIELIPKALKAYGDFEEIRWKKAQDLANSRYKWATTDHFVAWDEINANINAKETAFKYISDKHKAVFTEEQYDAFRNLSGFQQRAVEQIAIRQQALTFEPWLQEQINIPLPKSIDIHGRSLQQLQDSDKPELKKIRAALNHYRSEFENSDKFTRWKDSDDFLKAELLPYTGKVIEKQLAIANANQTEKLQQVRRDEDFGAHIAMITSGDFADPIKAVDDIINIRTGGIDPTTGKTKNETYRQARNYVIAVLNHGVDTGKIPKHVIDTLKEKDIVIGNQNGKNPNGKSQKWGDVFSKEFEKIDGMFLKRYEADQEKYENNKKLFAGSLRQNLAAHRAKHGRLFKQQEQQVLDSIDAAGFDSEDTEFSFVKDGFNVEELTEAVADRVITNLSEDGDGLTVAELLSGRFSQKTIEKYQKETVDGLHSIDKKDKTDIYSSAYQALQAGLDGDGVIKLSDQRSSNVKLMQPLARGDINRRFKAISKDPILSAKYNTPISRLMEAARLVNIDIKNGVGHYKRSTLPNGETDYQNGRYLYFDTDNPMAHGSKLMEATINNPEFVFTKGNVDDAVIAKIKRFSVTNEVPVELVGLEKFFINKDHIDVMNGILLANDPKADLIERKGINKIPTYVAKDFRRDVLCKGSYMKAVNACKLTAEKTSIEDAEKVPSIFWEKEAVDLGLGNPYNAMSSSQKGSTNFTEAFGKDINQFTVGELIALGDQGRLNTVGAFLAPVSDLNKAVALGNLDPDQLFNEETQNRFFYDKMAMDVSMISTADGDPIPGIGHYYPQAVYPSKPRTRRTRVNPNKPIELSKVFNKFLTTIGEAEIRRGQEAVDASQAVPNAISNWGKAMAEEHQKSNEEKLASGWTKTKRGRWIPPRDKNPAFLGLAVKGFNVNLMNESMLQNIENMDVGVYY